MKENDNHLPLYGVGPFLITPMVITAIIGLILSQLKLIPVVQFDYLQWVFLIMGVLLIVVGVVIWIVSATSNLHEGIKSNTLVTTGIYGIIRHPIYAAFLYASSGIILMSYNLYLLILPVIYWIFLSEVLKKTEEKWLIDTYGDDYIQYSKKVNRFIPKLV